MCLVGNHLLQQGFHLGQLRRIVAAKGTDVIAEVVENHGRIAVHALEGSRLRTVQRMAGMKVLHQERQIVQPGTVGHGDGAVGIRVAGVEPMESLTDGAVVGILGQQVFPDAGIRHAVGHDFRGAGNKVTGHVTQVVGHFQRGHVAVVEKDVFHLQPTLRETAGEGGDFCLVFRCQPPEKAGQRRVRVFPVVGELRGSPCLLRFHGQPSHAVAAHNQGVTLGGGGPLHIVQDVRESGFGGEGRAGVFLHSPPGAGSVIDRDFKKFRFRGTGGQEDEYPFPVQFPAGDGFLHVGDILVEITRQVGRPRQVHEEGPLVVGGREVFFLATRQAGESDDKQYGEEADKCHDGNV